MIRLNPQRLIAMKKYARVIEVPTIEESEKAYDHHRPISSLLMHQLRHLHAAEQVLPEKDRTGVNISQLHTEFEASKYIQKIMKKLHPPDKNKKVVKAGKQKPVAMAKKRHAAAKKRK